MHGYAAMVKRKFNISSRQEKAKKNKQSHHHSLLPKRAKKLQIITSGNLLSKTWVVKVNFAHVSC